MPTPPQFKAERCSIEGEYTDADRDAWREASNLDDVVEASDIATVVARWTGIPVNTMLEGETAKLLRMEEAAAPPHRRPG